MAIAVGLWLIDERHHDDKGVEDNHDKPGIWCLARLIINWSKRQLRTREESETFTYPLYIPFERIFRASYAGYKPPLHGVPNTFQDAANKFSLPALKYPTQQKVKIPGRPEGPAEKA